MPIRSNSNNNNNSKTSTTVSVKTTTTTTTTTSSSSNTTSNTISTSRFGQMKGRRGIRAVREAIMEDCDKYFYLTDHYIVSTYLRDLDDQDRNHILRGLGFYTKKHIPDFDVFEFHHLEVSNDLSGDNGSKRWSWTDDTTWVITTWFCKKGKWASDGKGFVIYRTREEGDDAERDCDVLSERFPCPWKYDGARADHIHRIVPPGPVNIGALAIMLKELDKKGPASLRQRHAFHPKPNDNWVNNVFVCLSGAHHACCSTKGAEVVIEYADYQRRKEEEEESEESEDTDEKKMLRWSRPLALEFGPSAPAKTVLLPRSAIDQKRLNRLVETLMGF
ncbi:hypothetical protein HDU97_005241 [Phlyctochytrium planicorne]|nr:hypothetical protein HDU97_005241 [Phlyctochytrium planicorne]